MLPLPSTHFLVKARLDLACRVWGEYNCDGVDRGFSECSGNLCIVWLRWLIATLLASGCCSLVGAEEPAAKNTAPAKPAQPNPAATSPSPSELKSQAAIPAVSPPATGGNPATPPPSAPGAKERPANNVPTVPEPPPPTVPQLHQWLADLNADDYAVREQATLKLGGGGAAAVPLLLAAAQGTNLEITARSIRALQALSLHTDEKVYQPAEEALDLLSVSENKSIARRVGLQGGQQMQVRQRRILKRLEKFGAIITYQGSPTLIPTGPNGELLISDVRLDEDWKGGAEGLQLLRRLPGLQRLYVIEGSSVTPEAVEQLKTDIPNLFVQFRGRALLGVEGASSTRGCEILNVNKGTAADKGGIQPGDLILTYAGVSVKTFEELIEITRKKKAGDTIQIEVLRADGKKANLRVTLGGWRGDADPKENPKIPIRMREPR